MPKISVIIPVFNAEKSLNDLFGYIKGQTYSDFEVVFVNDGSCDNSQKLLEEFCKNNSNCKLITKENGGVSSARNQGMEVAKGDYFVFWDADDKISESFLLEMSNNLQNGHLTLCGCYDEGLSQGRLTKIFKQDQEVSVLSKNEVVALQNVWLFNTLWNKIFDRKIIEELNLTFDQNSSYGEDAEFVAKYIKKIDAYKIINKPLYTYLRSSSNATSRFHRGVFLTNKNIYESVISSLDKEKSDYEKCLISVKKVYAITCIDALWHYCQHSKQKTNKEIKFALKDMGTNKNLIMPKVNLLLKIVLKCKWCWLAKLYYKIVLRGKK